jgi:oxepin-CoA hydrolase / 3-oxo-5,6-dehydrosuberyl-CoA semialdehyde dehydrogenase
MIKLGNFVTGRWIEGANDLQILNDAITGIPVYQTSSRGLNFQQILDYGRNTGNPALRKMSFHERGRMLKALALHLTKHLEKFYRISYQTGATRADSWIDIEGGIGNLYSYASLRRKFPDKSYCTDGDPVFLGKLRHFMGHHILVPKEGVAVHINAYNFPVWGMLEKIAVNLLAGVPAIVKPATCTSFLTEAVVREIDASQILPAGALQLICGSTGNMLDLLTSQDTVTFTGSAMTGLKLKSNPFILKENVPFTMEADSLNCIVLGNDVDPSMPEWEIFVKEVRREMTVKTGQKCTAIRRIFVPENKLDDMRKSIIQVLSQTVIGNPRNEKVRMGPLAGIEQREDLKKQVGKLLASSQLIYGSLDSVEILDADFHAGAFISPLLLINENPLVHADPHQVEAFGPVSTLMPYKTMDDAIMLSKKGKGSLCSTIVTNKDNIAKDYVVGAATHHGRILILDRKSAKESTGHGSPLPMLVHGGPGRAGGGEEMGGIRGVKHYMQRAAVQGSPDRITSITDIYQPHATQKTDDKHPFKKYFEELEIGDSLHTALRKITADDISEFASLSGDHFYAHDENGSFADTLFTQRVAHGYFILSAAAGLFVDAAKGPVLLNYGIDECRFLKPVYIETTIGVHFTCKEKTDQEIKETGDIPKGIVKWYVDVYDETGESVMIATILTMVRKKEDS